MLHVHEITAYTFLLCYSYCLICDLIIRHLIHLNKRFEYWFGCFTQAKLTVNFYSICLCSLPEFFCVKVIGNYCLYIYSVFVFTV